MTEHYLQKYIMEHLLRKLNETLQDDEEGGKYTRYRIMEDSALSVNTVIVFETRRGYERSNLNESYAYKANGELYSLGAYSDKFQQKILTTHTHTELKFRAFAEFLEVPELHEELKSIVMCGQSGIYWESRESRLTLSRWETKSSHNGHRDILTVESMCNTESIMRQVTGGVFEDVANVPHEAIDSLRQYIQRCYAKYVHREALNEAEGCN